MKLEEAKKNLQNAFKWNLNEISRRRYKLKEQNSTLENVKLSFKPREAIIKLFSDYSLILSEAKYKALHGKGIPSMSARVARGRVAKVSDHSNLKMWNPKQMLQRLPIAFAQVKAGNTSANLLKWNQTNYIFSVSSKRNY